MQPIEWAVAQKNKKVRVVLRSGRMYKGILRNYDENVNLLMDDTEFGVENVFLGKTIINGNTVAYIECLE
ncbi:U6 snRNA-associated Sm-like protein LSm8 [Nematocida sp. LUAm3]|nr:U6 snRNA-associated Sm-like protein LSm8 [Nematocida sp. LUAm3]KAI5175614.1 U6 snRNA-associated Sm-like protein LSm8 [Nematocida sp. LUAm2]KAI5178520.1 U6 snRNA-associated Sm-like protein LSm8 [Nematocida sp. LUAm1]